MAQYDLTPPAQRRIDWSSPEASKRLKRRYRSDFWLRLAGIGSIGLAVGLLGVLIAALVAEGRRAFVKTTITYEVFVDPAQIVREDMLNSNWRLISRNSLVAQFPEVESRAEQRLISRIPTSDAQYKIRDVVMADPSLIGQRFKVTVPVSDAYDQLAKGRINRAAPEEERTLNDRQIAWFEKLKAQGAIKTAFNWALFANADSRSPENAGLLAGIIGSFYMLLVCLVVAFPVGIAAAVYLEEFAPKNRWTDLIEVNINNLAAVPSIVFGLLGLAVFLNFFNLPRSTPLVGGLVLALMSLPTIIIATRAALKAVPPSIREAALGVGASKHQVVFDHVLPLAMPGILTGTIIALAHALGETAPLMLIGMQAFITSAPVLGPEAILTPATTLPTQIYIWSDNPERGFTAMTSAAILVLLTFLVMMNGLAIYLRNRFERKW